MTLQPTVYTICNLRPIQLPNSNRVLAKMWNDKGNLFLFEEHSYGVYRSNIMMSFEEDIRRRLWKIKTDDVVIDAGACYGSYTLHALAAGAIVYAFEVNDYIMKSLQNNIILNNFDKRCFLIQKALWSESGLGIKISDDGLSTMMEVVEKWTFTSETITIDDYMQDKTKLDWIKIDVEGAEIKVLEGAVETIKQYKPKILLEVHDFDGFDNPRRIKSFFNRLSGYECDDPIKEGRVFRTLYHPIL